MIEHAIDNDILLALIFQRDRVRRLINEGTEPMFAGSAGLVRPAIKVHRDDQSQGDKSNNFQHRKDAH
jgi:hypothetical protein